MQPRPGFVRRPRRAHVALGLLLVAGLTAGCTGSSSPSATSSSTPTPVSSIDLSGVVPARAAFCDALDPGAVAEVLGGEPEDTKTYRSGQRAEVAVGVDDVSHEYSCAFERGSDAQLRTARAWLFAQRVTPGQARVWIDQRRSDDGCRTAGELAFGDPGLVQACSASKTRRRVTAVGLFGDAWLSCQTTAPKSSPKSADQATQPELGELLELTERWCAGVALATTTTTTTTPSAEPSVG